MTRTFDVGTLPDGLLVELLDTARRAPTAGYAQGVHFLALQGPSLQRWWDLTVEPEWREEIAAGIGRAAAVVIPVADPQAYMDRYSAPDKLDAGLAEQADWPVPYWLTDTAMATQNLLLLVEASGLGALFYGLFRDAEHLHAFGVPRGMVGLGAVAIGWRATTDRPSGSPRHVARRATADVIHLGQW